MDFFVWLVPALALLILLSSIGFLVLKAAGLAKQSERLLRRTERFLLSLPKKEALPEVTGLPDLKLAKQNRKTVIADRTKKRAVRQRRLVKRINNLVKTEENRE